MDVLVAWQCLLSKFYLSGRFMENLKCDKIDCTNKFSKWVYGSILRDYVKEHIKKCVSLSFSLIYEREENQELWIA